MRTVEPLRNPRRTYCAGPLFNAAERREMEEIAAVLRGAGFEPFVPHADGMEFVRLHPYLMAQGRDPGEAGQCLHSAIFALDVYQVVAGCGSLAFNMNGRVPDEGAVAEATMAWMLGKPVVAYKEDARSAIAGRDNPLVVGPVRFESVRRLEQIPVALEKQIVACSSDEGRTVDCPPHLSEVVSLGERLWNVLAEMGTERDVPETAEITWQLFGPAAQIKLSQIARPRAASPAGPRSGKCG